MSRPHIVILGAGFGGVYVARKLARAVKKGTVDVTIINRTNYFLFTPLLHEVATGGLSPRSVAEPLREVFAGTGIRVIQADIEKIDTTARTASLKGHINTCSISYDRLIIATGAETNYYGIPGAEMHTMALKNLQDAYLIRNKVIDLFEQAVLERDTLKRRELLAFTVVGGGATGVEVAAELKEFIDGMVRRYYRDTEGQDVDGSRPDDTKQCHPEEPSMTLVHGGKELLEQFSPGLRKAASERLQKNGITIKSGSTVATVTKSGITLADGSSVPSSLIVWAAGVKPIIPAFARAESVTAGGGRLAVDEYFRLLKHKDIFALGDVSGYIDQDAHAAPQDPTKPPRPLPMLAQVAVSQARIVSTNVLKSLDDDATLSRFHYHSKGSMVSVGQWFAIGEIFSFKIAGKITWWMWRTVYLFKFSSWPKRIQIVFEWTLAIFYPRDITKLS
ncbi:MAG: NAD(P)/FAD-dependent oxidoreductase [Patescibacteria group bacterium]